MVLRILLEAMSLDDFPRIEGRYLNVNKVICDKKNRLKNTLYIC